MEIEPVEAVARVGAGSTVGEGGSANNEDRSDDPSKSVDNAADVGGGEESCDDEEYADSKGSECCSGVHSGHVAVSKNQLKRLRRAEKINEYKGIKKAAEKDRKRAAKRLRAEQKQAAEPPDESVNQSDGLHHQPSRQSEYPENMTEDERRCMREERKLRAQEIFIRQCESRFAVIVDCDFESCHSEGPLKSLSQQLAYCYGYNRRAPNPVHLYFTGVGPKLKAQMSKSKCENWQIVLTSSCYSKMPEFCASRPKATQHPEDVSAVSGDGLRTRTKQLVYLTADADEVLTSFDNDCAYIIGGIVDRNRYKGITHKKALEQVLSWSYNFTSRISQSCLKGVRTAKLPIREHVNMSATPVLTVNHVFEIMLLFDQSGCWKTSLEKVLPQRKDPKLKNDDGIDEEVSHEHNAV
jgi:tRNA (guanine9-N1)-methyltransferase